jgi:hypothetical protein
MRLKHPDTWRGWFLQVRVIVGQPGGSAAKSAVSLLERKAPPLKKPDPCHSLLLVGTPKGFTRHASPSSAMTEYGTCFLQIFFGMRLGKAVRRGRWASRLTLPSATGLS